MWATRVWHHFLPEDKATDFFNVDLDTWMENNIFRADKHDGWMWKFIIICWHIWCTGNSEVIQGTITPLNS